MRLIKLSDSTRIMEPSSNSKTPRKRKTSELSAESEPSAIITRSQLRRSLSKSVQLTSLEEKSEKQNTPKSGRRKNASTKYSSSSDIESRRKLKLTSVETSKDSNEPELLASTTPRRSSRQAELKASLSSPQKSRRSARNMTPVKQDNVKSDKIDSVKELDVTSKKPNRKSSRLKIVQSDVQEELPPSEGTPVKSNKNKLDSVKEIVVDSEVSEMEELSRQSSKRKSKQKRSISRPCSIPCDNKSDIIGDKVTEKSSRITHKSRRGAHLTNLLEKTRSESEESDLNVLNTELNNQNVVIKPSTPLKSKSPKVNQASEKKESELACNEITSKSSSKKSKTNARHSLSESEHKTLKESSKKSFSAGKNEVADNNNVTSTKSKKSELSEDDEFLKSSQSTVWKQGTYSSQSSLRINTEISATPSKTSSKKGKNTKEIPSPVNVHKSREREEKSAKKYISVSDNVVSEHTTSETTGDEMSELAGTFEYSKITHVSKQTNLNQSSVGSRTDELVTPSKGNNSKNCNTGWSVSPVSEHKTKQQSLKKSVSMENFQVTSVGNVDSEHSPSVKSEKIKGAASDHKMSEVYGDQNSSKCNLVACIQKQENEHKTPEKSPKKAVSASKNEVSESKPVRGTSLGNQSESSEDENPSESNGISSASKQETPASLKKRSKESGYSSTKSRTQDKSSPIIDSCNENSVLKSSSPSKWTSFDVDNTENNDKEELSALNDFNDSDSTCVTTKKKPNFSDSGIIEGKISQNVQSEKKLSEKGMIITVGSSNNGKKLHNTSVNSIHSLDEPKKLVGDVISQQKYKGFVIEDFEPSNKTSQLGSCQDSDSDAESRKAIMESAQRRIEQNLSTSESDSRHLLKTVHKLALHKSTVEEDSSDSGSAPENITFESSRKTAMESLKNAVESIQREKQWRKAKRKERLEKLKQQKEEKLIRLKEKLASQEDASCSSSEESGYEEVTLESKRGKKKKTSKSKSLRTEKENVDGTSVPVTKKTNCSDVESDDSTAKVTVPGQLPTMGGLKRLPSDVLDSLPDQIPIKLPKMSQEEKNRKKRKREKTEAKDNLERDFKKPSNLDYIPLESGGATKFGVVPLEKAMKAPKSISHQAADFRQKMLYGSHIRREPAKTTIIYQQKLKASGKDRFVR